MRLKLTLEYEGTRFRGWAAQPNLRTVEGVVRDPLSGRVRKVITTYGPTNRRVAVPMEWVVQHTPTRLVLGSGHTEHEGLVMLDGRPEAEGAAPTRSPADRTAHADDERFVFQHGSRSLVAASPTP